MRNRSKKFLTEVEIGQNVLIPIPDVDRGKGDPRNVMAVVAERVQNVTNLVRLVACYSVHTQETSSNSRIVNF